MSDPNEESAAVPRMVGGRYELLAAPVGGRAELLDTQPWRRCWSCGAIGTDEGERFCAECGAHLEPRRYVAYVSPIDNPTGPALIEQVEDKVVRMMLPTIHDTFEDEGLRYTLLDTNSRQPPALPLDELVALKVGRDLANLAAMLHQNQVALGPLAANELTLDAAGTPRLLSAVGLYADPEGDAVASDLRSLAALIESFTATPRVTRRLDEDAPEPVPSMEALPNLLRDLRTGAVPDARALATRLDALVREREPLDALPSIVGAATNKGMVRDHNEDSLLFLELRMNQNDHDRAWGLYIVADGMGGHAAGEVASGLAIQGAAETVMAEYLAPKLGAGQSFDEAAIRELMRQATLRANEYVLGEARARGNDMGTTLTMALVIGDCAYIANVGDSRTYLLREGTLRRVSKDHSLVMRLVDLGQITEEDIYSHPQRNAVLRSLGDRPNLEVDLFIERLRPGDTLFLCSDGQWEMTRDPEMAQIITMSSSPQAAAAALIEAANKAGGEDNITSIVVAFGAA